MDLANGVPAARVRLYQEMCSGESSMACLNEAISSPGKEPGSPYMRSRDRLRIPASRACRSARSAPAESCRRPSLFSCLLYTSDAADDLLCVDLGGRRIIKK